MCRKIEYANKRAAKRAIGRSRTRGARVRRTYRCARCGWWHLTSEHRRRPQGAA